MSSRDDVSFVGPLVDIRGNSDVFMMLISSRFPSKYYLAVSSSLLVPDDIEISQLESLVSYISFSAGYIGSAIQSEVITQYPIFFKCTRYFLSGGTIQLSMDMYRDPLGTQYIGGFDPRYLYFQYYLLNPSNNTQSQPINITTDDPNSYNYPTLLTGVRYNFFSQFYINDCRELSGELSGLCEFTPAIPSLITNYTDYVMTFIPVNAYIQGSCQPIPGISGYLRETLKYAQCTSLKNYGFGSSRYCSDVGQGFTSISQCRLDYPIYYYGNSCDEPKSFYNYYGVKVNPNTAIGSCDGFCSYEPEGFTCQNLQSNELLDEDIESKQKSRDTNNINNNPIILFLILILSVVIILSVSAIIYIIIKSRRKE